MNNQNPQPSARGFTAGMRPSSSSEQARYQNFINDPNDPWIPISSPEQADPIVSTKRKPAKVKAEFNQLPES
jgi:hypothetical protein